MITVQNLKHYHGPGEYVGRALGTRPASPLGNPFKLQPSGPYTRAEAIARYRRWLWQQWQQPSGPAHQELLRLAELARQGDLVLLCWCKHPGCEVACHADVVEACLEWLWETSRNQPGHLAVSA
jgi:hypothetical protein